MSRQVEHRPPLGPGQPPIEVVRSTRRQRAASAFERDGRIVVQLPAWLPAAEADATIANLVGRITGRAHARRRGDSDWLLDRAVSLGAEFLDGVAPTSVTWSQRMTRRWASASPADGTLRVSQQLATVPDEVLDYILVHELAHLLEANHSPAFHALVARYPHAQWAKGFLAGMRHAAGSLTGASDEEDGIDEPS